LSPPFPVCLLKLRSAWNKYGVILHESKFCKGNFYSVGRGRVHFKLIAQFARFSRKPNKIQFLNLYENL
jgi:hypothetical protein